MLHKLELTRRGGTDTTSHQGDQTTELLLPIAIPPVLCYQISLSHHDVPTASGFDLLFRIVSICYVGSSLGLRTLLDLCIGLNSTVLQTHMPRPHSLRPLDCTTEVKVFQRKIQIGADGSLVHDGRNA